MAINEGNQVAINVRMANGRLRSLRWTPGGGFRFLPLPPGATFSFVHSIDDQGNIYGFAPGTFFGWGNFAVWVGLTPMPVSSAVSFAGRLESAEGCGYAVGDNVLFKSAACP